MMKSFMKFLIRLWPAIIPPVLLFLLTPIRDSGSLTVLAGNAVDRQEAVLALIYLYIYLATLTLTPIMIITTLLEAAHRWWLRVAAEHKQLSQTRFGS